MTVNDFFLSTSNFHVSIRETSGFLFCLNCLSPRLWPAMLASNMAAYPYDVSLTSRLGPRNELLELINFKIKIIIEKFAFKNHDALKSMLEMGTLAIL